jgi:hypothetical protein
LRPKTRIHRRRGGVAALAVAAKAPAQSIAGVAGTRSAAEQVVSARRALVDSVFLSAVVVLSVIPYVGRLGFYYDDYSVLGRMNRSPDQSLLGLYDAVRPGTGQRPLQAFIFAGLYRLFGWHPLGYHILNVLLLVIVAVLMYLVLRELRLPRLVCVAIPLVYSMLPHYSTERFWLDAFQISLSTTFYLLSLYASLRAARSTSLKALFWVLVAISGMAGSLLAYEVVFPLFALNLVLVWWTARRRAEARSTSLKLAIIGSLALATVAVGVLKSALVATHGQNGYAVGFKYGLAHQIGDLLAGAIKVNFGTYLFAFPYVLWWIFLHRFSAVNAITAFGIGLLSFVYLLRAGSGDAETLMGGAAWRRLVKVGFVALVLGYAIFLATPTFLFRSAGIDNRINAAAALGVATMVIGGLGLAAGRLSPRRQVLGFSAGVALVVVSGVFVIETLSSFWTSAAGQQRRIVSAIAVDAARIPKSGILILDGACPEAGPTPIFADQWDLREALKFRLKTPSLVADVAGAGMRVDRQRLAIEIRLSYGIGTQTYPLGRRLVVFDYRRRRLRPLRNQAQARHYVAERPAPSCPAQRTFAWGFNPTNRWSLR